MFKQLCYFSQTFFNDLFFQGLMKKLIFVFIVFLLFHVVLFGGATKKLDKPIYRNIFSGRLPHFGAFFVMCFLASLVLMNKVINTRFPLILSLFYSVSMAFIVEIVQKIIGYRTFSEKDILYGALGALCYAVMAKIFMKTSFGKKIFDVLT